MDQQRRQHTTTCVPGSSPNSQIKTSPLLRLLVVPKRLLQRGFFTAASPVQPPPATTNEPFLIRAHCVTSLSLWWSFSPSPTGFCSIRRFTRPPWSLAQPPLQDIGRFFDLFFLFWCCGCCAFLPVDSGSNREQNKRYIFCWLVARECVPQLLLYTDQ